MRILAGFAIAAMTGCVWAGPKVTVCLALGPNAQPVIVAENLASKIFAGIGVEIVWPERLNRVNPCPVNSDIVITLSYHTSPADRPRAWAYARPYEGKHIVVFWDRVQQKAPPERVPFLLSEVLVHEITHILEGTDCHSESGVMKAVWDEDDMFKIWSGKPLGFAKRDLQLIHRGLEVRSGAAPGVAPATREK